MRTFSVAAVGTDGTVGPDTWKLRSTSVLAGRTLAEVEAALAARGLRLGTVRGSGSSSSSRARRNSCRSSTPSTSRSASRRRRRRSSSSTSSARRKYSPACGSTSRCGSSCHAPRRRYDPDRRRWRSRPRLAVPRACGCRDRAADDAGARAQGGLVPAGVHRHLRSRRRQADDHAAGAGPAGP